MPCIFCESQLQQHKKHFFSSKNLFNNLIVINFGPWIDRIRFLTVKFHISRIFIDISMRFSFCFQLQIWYNYILFLIQLFIFMLFCYGTWNMICAVWMCDEGFLLNGAWRNRFFLKNDILGVIFRFSTDEFSQNLFENSTLHSSKSPSN